MSALFADTFYFLALLNPTDEFHQSANRYSTAPAVRLITTAFVLTELADGLAETSGRTIFRDFVTELERDPSVIIVPADDGLWRRGVELYDGRRDKEWSLTDCISFLIMGDRKIEEALTGDHHFEQAGFRILLKK